MTKASTEASQAVANAAELRAEIAEIERAIDAGAYRPGPWARLLTRARAASPADRSAISANVSSVSRKLHLRRARNTIRPQIGVIIEIAGVGLGDFLLALGASRRSPAWRYG